MQTNPHFESGFVSAGSSLEEAEYAAILVHGRTQSPAFMLGILEKLCLKKTYVVCPAAANNTWYPNRFTEDSINNEPYLSNAFRVLDQHLDRFQGAGIAEKNIILMGFSQGACLIAEYLINNARRPRLIVLCTGGYHGKLALRLMDKGFKGSNVYISNGDQDPWIPLARTFETAHAFASSKADVTLRIIADREHEVSENEIADVQKLIDTIQRE